MLAHMLYIDSQPLPNRQNILLVPLFFSLVCICTRKICIELVHKLVLSHFLDYRSCMYVWCYQVENRYKNLRLIMGPYCMGSNNDKILI